MPPTSSTEALITDENMDGSSFLEKMQHQQMLLYIVCGLGGFCFILIIIFVVCKCKSARDRRKAEERQKKKRANRGRGNAHRGSKVKPEELKKVRKTENRSRKRSMDMRNGTNQKGDFKQMSIEEFNGDSHM
jgi:flagellar biosynthesis/type III secretory pathway M-ring protein FliF/YscJ